MPNTHKIPNKDPTPSIYPTNERVQLKQTTAPLLAGYVTLRKFLLCKTQTIFLPGGPVVNNHPSNAGDTVSIPGQGTKIPHGN